MNKDLLTLTVGAATGNETVRALYEQLVAKQVEYDVIDRYWRGDHPLQFATEKFNNAFGWLFRALSNNYCPRVCQALSDYLQLSKLTSSDEALDGKLGSFWEQGRLDFQSGRIHTDAFRYGDAYAIFAPDAQGALRLYKQSSRNVRVMYDDEEPDRVRVAIKAWQRADRFCRLNVYVPGRVLRFVTRSRTAQGAPAKIGGFVPFDGDGGPEQVTREGQIPVFHWPNEPGDDGNGTSELDGIVPSQDWLNKSLCDMLVAMEYQAFKQRWATGIEVDMDKDGKAIPPAVSAIDRLLFSGNPEAKFGEFGALDLKQFLEVSEAARVEIARVSRIPLHHLAMTMNFPSGEALKTADIPLTAKKRDRQICWGNAWEGVGAYYVGINPQQMTENQIEAEWEDVSPRSDLEHAQADLAEANAAMVKKNLGVSAKQVLSELGYTDEEIAQFDADNAQDGASMQGKLLDYFSRGGSVGGGAIIPARQQLSQARQSAPGVPVLPSL